jgi:hypothetical protein
MCSTVHHKKKKKSSWHSSDNFCESSKQQCLNSLEMLILLIFYILHSLYYDTIVTMSTNKMQSLRYIYNNVLIYIHSYMFWAPLAHCQGVQSCIKQWDLIIISNTWNCCKFTTNVWSIETDMCTENYTIFKL